MTTNKQISKSTNNQINMKTQPTAAAKKAATPQPQTFAHVQAKANAIKADIRALPKASMKPDAAISEDTRDTIIGMIQDAMNYFEDYGQTFRPVERMRMNGLGIRNYGFTQTALANASRNPQFIPSYLNIDDWRAAISDFQSKRDILAAIRQFEQLVRDGLRVPADAAFSFALEYYGALQEAARRGAPGAAVEFAELRTFFRSRGNRINSETPPTKAQLEKDIHALLDGKKDGEIVIRNKRAHLVGGEHEVIDRTSLDKAEERVVIDKSN
jgi:hypothetical protein